MSLLPKSGTRDTRQMDIVAKVTDNFKKMRNYYLLITLTAISVCSNGQNSNTDTDKIVKYFEWTEKIEYLKEPEYNRTILADNEKNRDTLFLQNFMAMNYDSVKLYNDFPYQPKELVKYLYAIDLNGDNLLDVFYQGPTGGEPNIIQIFLNEGHRYKKVFTGYQDIVNMKFEKDKLVSFRLFNPGCCADPQILEYNYEITYKKDEPIFSLNKSIGYLRLTEKVENSFNPVQKFAITVDKSNLRKECYFFDDAEHPVNGSRGNITATYKRGAKGKAIGFKRDQENEWIYVLMEPTSKIEQCVFSNFMEQPTQIYGWILKKDTNLE